MVAVVICGDWATSRCPTSTFATCDLVAKVDVGQRLAAQHAAAHGSGTISTRLLLSCSGVIRLTQKS